MLRLDSVYPWSMALVARVQSRSARLASLAGCARAARVCNSVRMNEYVRAACPHDTNVIEVTHQRLTDIGWAASFHDCLVDVRPLAALQP